MGELIFAEGVIDPAGLFADGQNEWHVNLLNWVNQTFDMIHLKSYSQSQRQTLMKHRCFADLMPKPHKQTENPSRWWRRFRQLKRWVLASARVPRLQTGSQMERKLGWWLAAARQSYIDGDLDQDRLSHLWAMPSVAEYFTMRRLPGGGVLSWEDRFTSLQTWLMTQNGRLPTTRSNSAEERQLAIWLQNSCAKARKDQLHPERMAKLKEVPGLRSRLISESPRLWVVWQRHFDSLIAWLRDHAKLPCGRSSNVKERLLAFWLHNNFVRAKEGDLAPEKKGRLEEALDVSDLDWTESCDCQHLKDWFQVHLHRKIGTSHLKRFRPRLSWDTWFNKFQAWYETNGRLPRRRGKTVAEISLARWLERASAAAKDGNLESKRMSKLSKIPDVSEMLQSQSQRQLQKIEALERWCAEHGRPPSKNSRASEEKQMGIWLGYTLQRAQQGMLPNERMERLRAIPCIAKRMASTSSKT